VKQIPRVEEVERLQRLFAAVPTEPEPSEQLVDDPINGSAAEPLLNGYEALPQPATAHLQIDRSRLTDRPIVMPEDSGPAAHAYRMLRTQLLQRARQQQVRTIAVVSAADREGRTVTAVNLALSIAADPNQAVLLVDLDLHRPSIASTLKLSPECGLEAWFAGRVTTLDEITYRVDGFERLSILPTLEEVARGSETLASVRSQAMLAELKSASHERLVLFDLAPLLLTDEFLTIAAHIDGVVVVAREGRTRREDLARMREILGGVRLLGTVLNHSSQFERRAY
jgi:Mrp family chromosome partitioning ATPase